MKGFISRGFVRSAAASLCVGAGALTLAGCTQYRAHVDPCWPERYNNESRQNIRGTFDAQAANGHALDQTIWNWDFEVDDKGNPTDKLSAGGQERLKYLARRRPVPDGRLYLQTANDLPVGTQIDQIAERRQDIDSKRIIAVQRYMGAIMAGRSTPVAWDIAVHDPAPVNLPASAVGGAPSGALNVLGAYPQLLGNFQGVFNSATGFTLPAGGGGGGGGAGAGGGGAGGGQQGQNAGGAQQGAGAPPSN